MTFLLLNLLQPRTPLPWIVIVAAVLAFAGGVALLVYFYRRYKRVEKETEEDWDLSRHSLFVNPAPPDPAIEEPDTPSPIEAEDMMAEEAPIQAGGTREFASDLVLPSFASEAIVEPEPQVEIAALDEPIQVETPAPPEPRPTEILASPSIEQPATEAELDASPATEAEHDAGPFDEEIWAGLEIAEQEAASQPTPEPLSVARVEEPAQRAPFEPPSIEPLSPAATRELRSAQSPGIEQSGREHPREHPEDRMARGTVRLGSVPEGIPGPLDPQHPERESRELAGELIAGAPVTMPEESVSAGAVPRGRSFGSVLGLPAEASHQPLILGEPARPADETGIGALTHYGQDLGPKGGRAGRIALFIVVGLLCGAAGLYVFVPSVHSRVGDFIARLRGTQIEDRDALKARAQIMPSSRPEVNKNMVTARGAVDNISDEALEKLEVEVSLQRGGDSPPEIRRIPVTPDVLLPGERGNFEFEYDGKRDTGFAGYTITRLFSNGTTEVRFRTPAQK
jgi:hypothetical protein